MPRFVALTCVLSAAALGALAADDLEVNDLRLKVGELDTTYKQAAPTVISSSPTYSTTLAKNADSSRRFELEWCHLAFGAGGGLVLGVDLAYQQTVFSDNDHRTTLSTPVADGVAGYCLRLVDPLHLEATLFGGMGRSSGDGASLSALRSGAAYYEYGARLALYATINGSWQLGVELPYRITRSSPTYHYTGSDGSAVTITETRRTVGGFAGLAVLGVRF
jgi:hypothetical protein